MLKTKYGMNGGTLAIKPAGEMVGFTDVMTIE